MVLKDDIDKNAGQQQAGSSECSGLPGQEEQAVAEAEPQIARAVGKAADQVSFSEVGLVVGKDRSDLLQGIVHPKDAGPIHPFLIPEHILPAIEGIARIDATDRANVGRIDDRIDHEIAFQDIPDRAGEAQGSPLFVEDQAGMG